MTTYEYPGYHADAELTASVVARVERVQAMLTKLIEELNEIEVSAEGGAGDVVLSVNHEGQLTSLSLAEGCTSRYTHLALEELINTTMHEAVEAATAEAQALTSTDGDEALTAAVEAFADPKSHIWTT
uniref:Nucleoid-associated protein YbaB n=1 Tax=Mycobacterium riyadhense TaxID=486698 RepID=A0A653EY90_9MYCO|nr:hypothetical protein BIN_B_04463 [Mycobacterium riyadhense]